MTLQKLIVVGALAVSLAGCSADLRPGVDQVESARAKLLGKWQARGSIFGSYLGYTDTQFEFFADGSVAESGKSRKGWQQERTGTFKVVDPTHVEVDEGWMYGTTIFKVDWQDNEHMTLRAGDNLVIPLRRVD